MRLIAWVTNLRSMWRGTRNHRWWRDRLNCFLAEAGVNHQEGVDADQAQLRRPCVACPTSCSSTATIYQKWPAQVDGLSRRSLSCWLNNFRTIILESPFMIIMSNDALISVFPHLVSEWEKSRHYGYWFNTHLSRSGWKRLTNKTNRFHWRSKPNCQDRESGW